MLALEEIHCAPGQKGMLSKARDGRCALANEDGRLWRVSGVSEASALFSKGSAEERGERSLSVVEDAEQVCRVNFFGRRLVDFFGWVRCKLARLPIGKVWMVQDRGYNAGRSVYL